MTKKKADNLKYGQVVRVGSRAYDRFWYAGRFVGKVVDNEGDTFYKVQFPAGTIMNFTTGKAKLDFETLHFQREFLH